MTFSRLEMDTFDCFKDGIVLIIISSGILYGASETQYTYVKDRTKGFFFPSLQWGLQKEKIRVMTCS